MPMSSTAFINYENPAGAQTAAKRRAVRSQAARHHWSEGADTRIHRRVRTNRIRKRSPNQLLAIREEAEVTAATLASSCHWTFSGAGRRDPFQTYPVPWQSYFPEVVDHYIVDMVVDVPELDGPRKKGSMRNLWLPVVMTQPSIFLTVMLLSASHLYSVQSRPNVAVDLLKLKHQALRTINESLANPSIFSSDVLIGAVAKMCSYEAVYGNMESYVAHMKGLRSLIELRGGLSSLGLDGFLRRMCLWVDLNSAFLVKGQRFFEGSLSSQENVPDEPNPEHFIGRID